MLPIVDVISIGHLSCNRFWNEQAIVRPPVATTSLIRAGNKRILVDPSLVDELLVRRLHERSGLNPEQIDMVFLTSFHPTHRRGISLFREAVWYLAHAEREAAADHLNKLLEAPDTANPEIVEAELALVGRTEPAPDLLAEGIHLFPCPGASPGCSGILAAGLQTTVIAGDAVLTRDHYENGVAYEGSADSQQALASMTDISEVADIIVPGHDNLFIASANIAFGAG